MKTTITRVGGGPMTLEAFAEKYDLEMQVLERPISLVSNPEMRYYANFKRVEVMSDGMLHGVYGNGETPELAIAEYAEKIAGERLAFAAGSGDERREFQAPNEFLEGESS